MANWRPLILKGGYRQELPAGDLLLPGLALPQLASDPASGFASGEAYWNTTDKKVRVYNGATWADAGGGTQRTFAYFMS